MNICNRHTNQKFNDEKHHFGARLVLARNIFGMDPRLKLIDTVSESVNIIIKEFIIRNLII